MRFMVDCFDALVIRMPFIMLVRATSERRMEACPCAAPCFILYSPFGLECLVPRLLAPGPLALVAAAAGLDLGSLAASVLMLDSWLP